MKELAHRAIDFVSAHGHAKFEVRFSLGHMVEWFMPAAGKALVHERVPPRFREEGQLAAARSSFNNARLLHQLIPQEQTSTCHMR